MTTEIKTTPAEIRDNAYETRESPSLGGIPVFWWGWPDEVLLADFVEQDARAEEDDRVERADQPIEESPEYAVLYFVS